MTALRGHFGITSRPTLDFGIRRSQLRHVNWTKNLISPHWTRSGRRFVKLTSTMPNRSTGMGASLSPCRPTPPARLDWGLRLTTSAEPCHYSGAPNSLLGHLGPGGWDLGHAEDCEPCRFNGRLRPATRPNRFINTEHINQLSCFHAQKLSILNFVRFEDTASREQLQTRGVA